MTDANISVLPRHYEKARAERALGCSRASQDDVVEARARYHAAIEASEARYVGMTRRQRTAAQLVAQVGEEQARSMMPHLFD